MKASPAFQFYVDNFIEGTIEMTDGEVGLYMRLLCAQWTRGGLPNSPDELLRFSRGSTTVELNRVIRKFKVGEDGLLRNDRIEAEREKQRQWRDKSAQGGRKSAESRKGGSTVVQPHNQGEGEPKGNTPSPSPSPDLDSLSAPEIPSVDEVVGFGASRLSDQIPEPFCRFYHRQRQTTNAWVRNGVLIQWRLDLADWWTRDRGDYVAKRHRAHPEFSPRVERTNPFSNRPVRNDRIAGGTQSYEEQLAAKKRREATNNQAENP